MAESEEESEPENGEVNEEPRSLERWGRQQRRSPEMSD